MPGTTLGLDKAIFSAIIVAAVAAGACDNQEPHADRAAPEVTLLAEHDGISPSEFDDVVLLPSGTACTPDSYLRKVRCYSTNGDSLSFGEDGEGPGEFGSLGPLMRVGGEEAFIGVVDIQHARFSVHDSNGDYQYGFPLPPMFRPLSREVSDRIVGLWMPYEIPSTLVGRIVHLAIPSGEKIRDVTIEEDRLASEGSQAGFSRGVETPGGDLLLHVAGFRFGRYSREGRRLAAFELPDTLRGPHYPSARDLEEYEADIASLFGRPANEVELRRRAERELYPLIPEATLRSGPDGTVWVAPSRAREKISFLDVFQDDEYLASIEVRHRLLGFDILGDTLVTLVERPWLSEGAYERGIDWYLIRTGEDPEQSNSASGRIEVYPTALSTKPRRLTS